MFTFRLEPLITLRDNALKERQADLAKAYEARQILETDIKKLDQQLSEGRESARTLMQEGQKINVDYLLGFRRQEMFLLANQDELKEKMAIIDEEIEVRRAAVAEANKELKIVEKLKEQRFEKYLEEQNKSEMKAMDEIAGNSRR
ncbi:MAG: flagellar export protein FliJ [Planctomycetaceae bacterium]|nr:flagellar export protein FliJ [Planctomycetaceae bacterium]